MTVLLVHGLGRSRFSMALLARRLSKSGHRVEFFSYSSLAGNQQRIVARLVDHLRQLSERNEDVGLVGHSFGGLLLREAAAQVPKLRVKHLIMLGTPNQPPRLAAKFYTRWPFRVIRGNCAKCLADPLWYARLPDVVHPHTIVAGTRGWRGHASPFNGELNDGLVSVSETKLNKDDEPILVPALHSFIMNNRSVYQLIVQRLT